MLELGYFRVRLVVGDGLSSVSWVFSWSEFLKFFLIKKRFRVEFIAWWIRRKGLGVFSYGERWVGSKRGFDIGC